MYMSRIDSLCIDENLATEKDLKLIDKLIKKSYALRDSKFFQKYAIFANSFTIGKWEYVLDTHEDPYWDIQSITSIDEKKPFSFYNYYGEWYKIPLD